MKDDTIYRQAAIDAAVEAADEWDGGYSRSREEIITMKLRMLPSAQPEPISEEYAKAVRTWLINYQVRCAELAGRYTPYEILGWIVSDWRKENEIW